MFSSFNAENYNRKQSQFQGMSQGIVKNMNENSNLNDNDSKQYNDKNSNWCKGSATINDLKSNIKSAKDKFNSNRANNDSIFKSSSQILNDD